MFILSQLEFFLFAEFRNLTFLFFFCVWLSFQLEKRAKMHAVDDTEVDRQKSDEQKSNENTCVIQIGRKGGMGWY